MATRHTCWITTTAGPIANNLDRRDEDVMQALVTASALVALSDGNLVDVERTEVVNFIDRQGFVPTISQAEIADAFDNRVQELEDRHAANVIMETLRPLAGLSLASVMMRAAERVAAADRTVQPGELHALKLIRLIMMSLPTKRPVAAFRGL